MEGEKWTSFCLDQDAGAERGERHTGNKLWRYSPNDNMASDFSTPQFHAMNDVSLYYVCDYNCSLILSSLVKKNRQNDLYTTQLFCVLHLNNHIFL